VSPEVVIWSGVWSPHCAATVSDGATRWGLGVRGATRSRPSSTIRIEYDDVIEKISLHVFHRPVTDPGAGPEGRTAGRLQHGAALVTGAAAGLGKAIAERLAREGARVAGRDIDTDALREALAPIGGEAIEANLRDPELITHGFAQARVALGQIDIVVNNAGVARDALVSQLTLDAWDTVLELDVRAPTSWSPRRPCRRFASPRSVAESSTSPAVPT